MNTPPCFTPPFKARLVPQRHEDTNYFIAAIETEKHCPIANVFHPVREDAQDAELIMHTACLFAASPKLLAALEQIGRLGGTTAEAAIAKAAIAEMQALRETAMNDVRKLK